MDHALTSLSAAALAFVGLHFAMSHPLRSALVARLGENGFRGLYSLVALGTFIWMVLAFRAAARDDLARRALSDPAGSRAGTERAKRYGSSPAWSR